MRNQTVLNGLHPQFRIRVEEWIQKCAHEGYTVVLTSGYRTKSQQDALYALGRTKVGRVVTNARGTPVPQSLHCFGLACDFAVEVGGLVTYDVQQIKECGKLARSFLLEWSGDWKRFQEYVHIQYTQGKPLSHFQNGGKLDPYEPVIRIPAHQKIILLTKRLSRSVRTETKRIISNVIERLRNRIS